MAFQLTITQGEEAGKQLAFEQPQVTIGRTPECDILLYDPGVSRQHARIRWDGGGYVVEDLGSANGTKVNGALVQRHSLQAGDAISVGPVAFKFSFEQADAAAAPAAEGSPPAQADNTRIVAQAEVRKTGSVPPPFHSVPPGPPMLTPSPVSGDGEGSTRIVAASELKRPSSPSRTPAPSVPPRRSNPTPAPGGALLKADGAPVARPTPSRPAPRSMTPGKPGALSAAERARMRRGASGLDGQVKMYWVESSYAKRASSVIFVTLLTVAAVAAAFYFLVGPPGGATTPTAQEPNVLTRTPLTRSFGYGNGVDFVHRDKKRFEFDFASPVRAVAILHYQAQDVSDQEVTIAVNGGQLGTVPADTLDSASRTIELVVPGQLLKKGERNTLVFNNSHYPREDPWQVSNLWIETAPLPELPGPQLVREANVHFTRGSAFLERKDVAKRNRFSAWREFRTAWLLLEGHPEPKPDLYRLALDRMHAAQLELDGQCAKLLVEVQRDVTEKDFKGAAAVLDDVKEWFPTDEQPCPARADQKRAEYGF